MGSKNRISKDILPLILESVKGKDYYIEPFCGGANLIDKVNVFKKENQLNLNLIGADKNRYLISLLDYLAHDGNFKYQSIPKDEWYKNYLHPFKKGELNLPTYEIGYLGFTKTFRSQFMGSFGNIEHQLQYHNNLMKQKENLKGINFKYSDYIYLEIFDNSIIYLDPPYLNTAKYAESINHNELYLWCCDIEIYLSEYTKIGDRFKEIFNKQIQNSLNGKMVTEKLFKFI
jgi:DNA adenine methylase